MARFTVVSKIRLLACIAPVILLIVIPIAALAFTQFGSLPGDIREHELAALRYAQGLDTALYKMEWGRTQPDGHQIVLDQQRRFADLMDSEVHVIYTLEQHQRLEALVKAAKPTLDAFRAADPRDDSVNPRMRDLHVMVGDLMSADDEALAAFGERTAAQARQYAILLLLAGILLPAVCLVVIWRLTGGIGTDLRAIRSHLERIAERPAGKDPAVAPDLEGIDASLARLGFPKPNPMLAE